jgi:thiol-disulfide isomerase/thioredoxin
MKTSALLTLLVSIGLPVLSQPAPTAVPVESELNAVLSEARVKGQRIQQARAAHIEAGKSSRDFKADVAPDLADLFLRLAKERRPVLRQALIVSQLFLLRQARETPAPELLAMVFREVPATFGGWALDKGLLLSLAAWAPGTSDTYLATARAGFPDGAVRRNLLFEYFTEMIDTSTEPAWRPSYEALQKDFSGSPEAVKAAERLASESKTAVGVMAPAFSVPALKAGPKTRYTLATFKGHYVLLDFWASWCPDCVAEMPAVHKAYARFKGKGLEILSLSFDRKVEHIAPYRKHPATPMPWKHTFLEGAFKNPLSEAYGVKSIPKPVLVGPDGRIVANGGQLHGANLEKTLETFLGK